MRGDSVHDALRGAGGGDVWREGVGFRVEGASLYT